MSKCAEFQTNRCYFRLLRIFNPPFKYCDIIYTNVCKLSILKIASIRSLNLNLKSKQTQIYWIWPVDKSLKSQKLISKIAAFEVLVAIFDPPFFEMKKCIWSSLCTIHNISMSIQNLVWIWMRNKQRFEFIYRLMWRVVWIG